MSLDPGSRLPFLSKQLTRSRPRTRDEALALFSELRVRPPADYQEFLSVTDGATGPIGSQGWVDLWGIDDIRETNRTFRAANLVDDLVLFGSDGGGDALAFDTGSGGCVIVRVPFDTLARADARVLGDTLVEALAVFGEE